MSSSAKLGLTFAILGIVLFWIPFLGLLLCIGAVALYGKTRAAGDEGPAIAALVTGIVGIIMGAFSTVAMLTFGFTIWNIASTFAPKDKKPTAIEQVANREEADYIKNYLVQENLQVGTGYGQFDVPGYSAQKPTVSGKIRNSGTRALDKVEVVVYFLDAAGNRIGEKSFLPVLCSEFSYGSDNTPLKPGYVKEWGYVVDDCAPSEWSKRVLVEIKSIRFSTSP